MEHTHIGCPPNQRRVYIDFLKIIAILMVVFNHTATRGFTLFTVRRKSFLYPFYLDNAVLVKMAVPLFFMASGALLLDREEPYRVLLKKRFLRFAVVLVAASAFVFLYKCHIGTRVFSVTGFIKALFNGTVTEPYWYLYRYLAFIAMLPLLRRLARAMANMDFHWMFLAYGIMRLLPLAEFLIWRGKIAHESHFSLFVEMDYVFFPLMGYYIDRRLSPTAFTRRRALGLSVAGIAAIAACAWMTHHRCTLLDKWETSNCQTFLNTLTFLPAVATFFVCRRWFIKHPAKPGIERCFAMLSELTFGIYLVEYICRNETKFIYLFLESRIKALPACWAWVLASVAMGGCIAFVLKKTPV